MVTMSLYLKMAIKEELSTLMKATTSGPTVAQESP
jgi:hypothetical protein